MRKYFFLLLLSILSGCNKESDELPLEFGTINVDGKEKGYFRATVVYLTTSYFDISSCSNGVHSSDANTIPILRTGEVYISFDCDKLPSTSIVVSDTTNSIKKDTFLYGVNIGIIDQELEIKQYPLISTYDTVFDKTKLNFLRYGEYNKFTKEKTAYHPIDGYIQIDEIKPNYCKGQFYATVIKVRMEGSSIGTIIKKYPNNKKIIKGKFCAKAVSRTIYQ